MLSSLIVFLFVILLMLYVRKQIKFLWPFKVYLFSDMIFMVILGIPLLALFTEFFKTGVPTPKGFTIYKELQTIDIKILIRLEVLFGILFVAVYLFEILYHYFLGKLYLLISKKSLEREKNGKKSILGIKSQKWKETGEMLVKIRKY